MKLAKRILGWVLWSIIGINSAFWDSRPPSEKRSIDNIAYIARIVKWYWPWIPMNIGQRWFRYSSYADGNQLHIDCFKQTICNLIIIWQSEKLERALIFGSDWVIGTKKDSKSIELTQEQSDTLERIKSLLQSNFDSAVTLYQLERSAFEQDAEGAQFVNDLFSKVWDISHLNLVQIINLHKVFRSYDEKDFKEGIDRILKLRRYSDSQIWLFRDWYNSGKSFINGTNWTQLNPYQIVYIVLEYENFESWSSKIWDKTKQ